MFEPEKVRKALDKVPGLGKKDKEECYQYLTTRDADGMVNDLLDVAPNVCRKVSARSVAEIANLLGATARGVSLEEFKNILETKGWSIWRKFMKFTGLKNLLIDAFQELPEEGHNVNRWTTIKGKHLTRNQSYFVNSACNLVRDIRTMLSELADRDVYRYNKFRSEFIRTYDPLYPKINVADFLDKVEFVPYPKYSGTPMDRVGQSYDWLGKLGLGDIYPGLNAAKKGKGVHPLIWALYDELKGLEKAEKEAENAEKEAKKAREKAAKDAEKARKKAAAKQKTQQRAADRARDVSQGAKTGFSYHLRR